MAKRKKRSSKSGTKAFNIKFDKRLVWLILVLGLVVTGFLYRQKIAYYYAYYFRKIEYKKLKNSEAESKRINRIIGDYSDKTFGFDISHYQRKEDVRWDSLSIAKGAIPLEFVVLRATMGNASADKNFYYFWNKAKENGLIRGAYHFYRADEDPTMQAKNFLKTVDLKDGDLRPVLDIEKIPKSKSIEKYISDIKIWLAVVEKHYGEKPIIYTYYHFYKDYLRGEFDDYPLWLANYNDVPEPSPDDDWEIWQFTENGIAKGVNAKIDLNIYNGSLWQLKMLTL